MRCFITGSQLRKYNYFLNCISAIKPSAIKGFADAKFSKKIQQAEAAMDSTYADVDSVIRVHLIALWDRKWF
ncbi:hypothetical protein J2Z83_003912 [Virgibacillus natechei]|uniref:Uncharacterized protein n=1 Tax=Virgibacillus natechei TaxID=1216297 RepID=A0ABS4ILC7_9BACI|nr:hypothetical protein [Virgibacillus natechei]MBP1971757.1 hypothetical protein [Virgibacillus natechei]UZD12899.1 hypothetical protein OLD84_18780 [Virgibacillus natechei]